MFVKAEEKKLYEQVVSQITNLISTGQLKEGDKLPSEDQLAKKFAVSRATVREGLRILGLMGLVETRRGKGTIVKSNTLESYRGKLGVALDQSCRDFNCILELDIMLEPSLARYAAQKADQQAIDKMRSALDMMEEAIAKGENGELEALYFHQCMIESIQNPLLTNIYDLTFELHKQNRANMSIPGMPTEILKDHCKIYDAIRKRNGSMAYQATYEHLQKVGETYNLLFTLAENEHKEQD